MSKIIFIPAPFLELVERNRVVIIEGDTVGEALQNLSNQYARLRKHLYSDNGRIRSFINVYVNDEDIKFLQDEFTELKEEDVIKIVPSITGGIT